MTWIVYMATNKVNGKRYIGVTGLGLHARKKRHLSRAFSKEGYVCPKFYSAIRNFGGESFRWRMLAKFELRELAYHHEFVLVDTLKPEYNAVAGGRSGPEDAGQKPVICLEDGRVHESATAAALVYGCDHSEVCKNCRGDATHVKWRHFRYSDCRLSRKERESLIKQDNERRTARMKRVVQKKQHEAKWRDGRAVICIDDGNVYKSASMAAYYYDANKSSVIEMCNGKKKWPVSGKRFAYIENIGQRWMA